MNDELLAVMREEICKAVEETVNGKIDIIRTELFIHNAKHEMDMEEMKPFMQGAAGLQIIFRICVAVGSLAVGWLAIKQIFK